MKIPYLNITIFNAIIYIIVALFLPMLTKIINNNDFMVTIYTVILTVILMFKLNSTLSKCK
jgi:hypothetical protein